MFKTKPKILITGCGGMLGEAVYGHFKDRAFVHATDIDVNEPWLHYMDVTDFKQVKDVAERIKPDYIFHLAALTDLEYCEQNPVEAYKVNALGTENVMLICKKLDIPMIYISTAGVFNGRQEFYVDYDDAEPLNVYGKSKYAGEKIVRENMRKIFVFRPGWMIGGGPKKDKKFIKKMIDQIKSGKKEIHVVDDKIGSPSYTYDFAKIIEAVITSCPYGEYNAVCEGGGSRYDVAKLILETKGLDSKIKIKKVKSSELKKHIKEDYFAPRPRSEQMINLKLKMRGINIERDWRICLKEYLNKFDWGV